MSDLKGVLTTDGAEKEIAKLPPTAREMGLQQAAYVARERGRMTGTGTVTVTIIDAKLAVERMYGVKGKGLPPWSEVKHGVR